MRADSAGELIGDCSGLPTSTTRFCATPSARQRAVHNWRNPQLASWGAHHRGFLRRLFGIRDLASDGRLLVDNQAQAALDVRQD